ncbi:CENP-S associating centromere protein X-domain-containing protein [Cadophora sp. MPI-SDFR-AT-0126]|nr:CENP-S associating centromere protein X-domain-containing protein [Leotiomycetes sp. MPI-SDFR-AT-0126]
MPPKPFNPPRPTSNAPLPGAKSRGRPKGSTNNPSTTTTTKRKSTNTLDKPSKSKPKSTPISRTKEKERERTSGFTKTRVSNASTVLDIASDDEDEVESDDEEEDVEMGEAEGSAAEDDDDDPFSSQPLPSARKTKTKTSNNPQQEPNTSLISNRQTSIPPDLINVLLHGFFQHENTRMSKDANAAVGRYIETFVREGLTRADYEKKHGWEDGGVGGGDVVEGGDGAYLEVEDLERLAPQLILDF